MIQLFLIFAFATSFVTCQTTEQEENCPGYTINNNIYGPDGYTIQPNSNLGGAPNQGKPGKIGPRGDTGLKGEKGTKGQRGKSDDSAMELRMMKQEISMLRDRLDKITLMPPSCSHINRSEYSSGTFLISPDPTRVLPFYVYCNFSENTAETIVNHDSINEIQVTSCEAPKCYQHRITYNVDVKQIIALLNRSLQCRQFIKYRCRGSVLFYGDRGDRGTWLSRDGTHMKYWGGATSQRHDYCSCGETGTCRNPTKKCNCDDNASAETSDEGYLTDKDTLPVTELQFGDVTSPSELGWHTLGPLICSD